MDDTGPVRLLLVEDDHEDYQLTREILADIPGNRYHLDWAQTYEAALEALVRCEHDVCLLDYRLGARTGLDLLAEAKAGGCKAAVIILTGHPDSEVDFAAMKAGASDFLVKTGLRPGDLERAIRYALQNKRHKDELETRVDDRAAELSGTNAALQAAASGRARAEEARQESEERYRMLFAAAPMALFVCDSATVIQHFNPRAAELWGREPVCGVEKHCGSMKLWLPDGTLLPHTSSPMVGVLRTGVPVHNVEVFIERPDGSRLPVLVNFSALKNERGEVTGAITSFIDITQRKQAESALRQMNEQLLLGTIRQHELAEQARSTEASARESEERFRAIADNIPQLAWMADADGHVGWFNRGWLDYTGTTLEDNTGSGWKAVHHPDHIAAVAEKFERHLREGKDWEDTFPLRGKDGEYRWFLSRMKAIRDETGRLVSFFGTNTDITEPRLALEEREQLLDGERAARAEAEHAGRLKDEFLATLSHELRTPLNAILGWTHILRKDAGADTLAQGLAVIDRNARVQAQLIADLLDMSRIVSGKMRLEVQRVELPVVIEAALDSVRPAAEAKEVRIMTVLEPLQSPVHGDPDRLQQVIWNLVSNAVKFTPRGGRVQVVLARVNSHVELSVSDTGKGIKPEFLPHVFERFRQADSSASRDAGGLGLGLAIVKQLVDLHGGHVFAASDGEGKGSTFTVHLPLAILHAAPDTDRRVHPKAVAPSPVHCDPPDLTGVRVLVVDDEHDARDLVKRMLEECGAVVDLAASADEAEAAIARNVPDVILSDIGMPERDGYALMRSIRRAGVKAPAAALTAFARSEDRTRALNAGYQTHIAKPVEPAELLATVASLAQKVNPHEKPTP